MLIEKRVDSCFRDLLSGMIERRTIIIKHIAGDRAGQVRYGRFLCNEKVTPERIVEQATARTGAAVTGKHVLLIEDSSQISFGLTPRAAGLGSIGTGTTSGFYIHPVLAVDADQRACYGLAAASVFKRPDLPPELQGADLKARKKYWYKQSFTDKSSKRWLDVPLLAQQCCATAARLTVIADREGDIYEALDGFQTAGLDFVVRMSGDRLLDGPGQQRRRQQVQASVQKSKARKAKQANDASDVSDAAAAADERQAPQPESASPDQVLIATVREQLNALAPAGSYELKLPATDKRSAHTATLDIKYMPARILRPQTMASRRSSPALDVYVVEVQERASSVVGKEKPVHWVLVTSHPVTRIDQAMQIVEWYRWRWDIEQTFRLLKSRGMDIESSGLQTYERLANLAAMALVAAVRVLQLVLARDHTTSQLLGTAFSEAETAFLQVLNKGLEGSTVKQRNPHPVGSLAYGSWVIARLGSWMCYGKTPPGPITMHRGLMRFYEQFEGYRLATGAT